MGMALGKITVETPTHVVVHKADNYQIWRYPRSLSATVHAKDLDLPDTATERDFTSVAFRSLARYIGVFGTPQNRIPNSTSPDATEAVAMTAPVEMQTAPMELEVKPETIAMTAPVVMKPDLRTETEVKDMKMSFFLPSKYSNINEAPVPTNPAVKLVEVPSRYHAVVQYSGNLTLPTSRQHADELLRWLEADSVKVVGEWSYCGYNPPITLPWLKRNEVHVPVDASQFDSVTENVE